MKFLATSDIHGYLPNITEEFDLLMICGDICPATDHSIYYQENWIKTIFTQWINSLPYKTTWSKVILVPGNHDFWFERMSEAQKMEIEMLCSLKSRRSTTSIQKYFKTFLTEAAKCHIRK